MSKGYRMKLPYPLRASKITVDINPFGFWFKPSLTLRPNLTEDAKRDGSKLWFFRFAWFQLSFSRWM